MARYTGPKCRLCRREGAKLYLKGTRCEGEKCAFTRKQQAPGQHGTSRRKLSQYGIQLREKQKTKRIYGVMEKQFKKYADTAMRSKGITGEKIMQTLETRLDNMVFRSGFAVSRAQARQLIRSGFFMINDNVINVASYKIKVGDVIRPIDFGKIHPREGFALPEWLSANIKEKSVKLKRLPDLDELSDEVNIQLIVEYYSR